MDEKIIIQRGDDRTISCYYSTEYSSLICTILIEQKCESDIPIDFVWNVNDRYDVRKMVENAITHAILDKNCTIKYVITFYVVQNCYDIFSCAINVFSCCAIVMGISLKDTLVSYSNDVCNVIYMLHKEKVLGFYIEGNLKKEKCFEIITNCINRCKSTGVMIKNNVIRHIESNM